MDGGSTWRLRSSNAGPATGVTWRAFDQASRELERDKEKLLDDIERRLTADIRRESLFTLRWRLL